MNDDELDFQSIQEIFAKRDEAKRKEAERESSKESSPKMPSGFTSVPLRSEPKYENMHAKNIHITPKGHRAAKKNNLVLVVGATLILSIAAFSFGVNQLNQTPKTEQGIVYMDENYHSATERVINPEECDFSNLTIILRRSTPNVGQVVSVAERELMEMGADVQTITSEDDMIGTIGGLKAENPNRQLVVINVDGVANKGSEETVIMTNYDNNAKSADVLAIAINEANEDIYGISSDIRCGKKDLSTGNRTKTSVELALSEAGYTDVACLTVAPNATYLEGETNVNNLATSIAEGVIRMVSLPVEEQFADLIRRVEFGDTISQLAIDYNSSEEYINSTNSEALSSTSLQYNMAIIAGKVPANLSSKVTVDNKSITTDSSEITTEISYYTVKANDTVSGIAEKLQLPVSDLVVPSGDPDVIKVGDKIGYEVEEGPILVTKNQAKQNVN